MLRLLILLNLGVVTHQSQRSKRRIQALAAVNPLPYLLHSVELNDEAGKVEVF